MTNITQLEAELQAILEATKAKVNAHIEAIKAEAKKQSDNDPELQALRVKLKNRKPRKPKAPSKEYLEIKLQHDRMLEEQLKELETLTI